MSFGGMPLIYYGDAIGTLNDNSYLDDELKYHDSRWIHRPMMDWSKAELRKQNGTIEQRIFSSIKKMIAVRKEVLAFADHNNREIIDVDNPHLFIFSRFDIHNSQSRVLVICNFDVAPQALEIEPLRRLGYLKLANVQDLYSGESFSTLQDQLLIPPLTFYWLQT